MSIDQKIEKALASNNQEQAYRLLIKTYQKEIIRLVKSKGGTKEEGEDIAQDIFVVFMMEYKKGKIDFSSSLKNWLLVIARNHWYNQLKRLNRTELIEALPDVEFDHSVSSILEHKEHERLIKDLFAKIGGTCQEILLLSVFEDKNQDEIALQLGLQNSQTVKSYKSRCKKKLLDIINKNKGLKNHLISNDERFSKYFAAH